MRPTSLADLSPRARKQAVAQIGETKAPKRPHKYGAKACEIDGEWFPSRREARRWQALSLLFGARKISKLKRQVRYPLIVNGTLVGTYVADFVYVDEAGKVVVEDSKGVRTPTYRLKRLLMFALYGISITET